MLMLFCLDSTCTLTFASPVTYAPGTDAEVVNVADFNMDNKKDFAVLYSGPGITSILLGKGDGTFQQPISFSNGPNSQPGAIIAGDFNNDNKVDIVVANLGSNNVDVFLGNDAGYFTLLNECFTGTNSTPAGVTLGDFNNDNILDFIVACESGNEVDVYLGIGYGSFYYYQTYPTGDNSGPTTSVVGDFNKDGQLDFIVSCFYGNNIIVYLGHGNGNFMQETTYSTDAGPYTPVTEDFNNDGILDVATSNYYANATSVFLGNGGGTFVLAQTVSTGTGSLPFDITAADFNNDQIVDLIVPNSGTNNVGILLGTGSGTFQKVLTHSTGANSSPFTADVGDFNGNGRIDAVAANQQAGDAAVLLNTCS